MRWPRCAAGVGEAGGGGGERGGQTPLGRGGRGVGLGEGKLGKAVGVVRVGMWVERGREDGMLVMIREEEGDGAKSEKKLADWLGKSV